MTWAVVLALACFSASAQETTSGSLAGQVVDAQGAPVPGATVTVTSSQGPKSFVTDAQGRFFAPFLTPGRYSVRVELTGFSTLEQKDIDVRLGQRLELKALVLKVGAITETVEVIGSSPIIDTASTTTGGTLDSEMLKRLPVGRNFTDTLYLVAGVSDSGGVGRANPSVSGASGLENQYVVDGVNITNTGYGGVGSYSIVFFSLGTGVTTDFIKETQVKTGGFEAEYGQSTGGVINVVTQSGTNSFRGSVFGYFRPGALESEYRQLTTPNGTVNTVQRDEMDFGLAVGGPIMKDKLFFFGAFNPQYQNRTFTAPAGFPLASQGDIERKRRILSYAGKLTWQMSGNHRFDLSAFGDPAKGENGPQRVPAALIRTDTAGFSEIEYGGHNQVLRYDGIVSRNWLVEASVANAKNTISELPSVNDWAVVDTTVVPTRTTGGIGFYEQGNEGKNLQYSLKSTHLFNAGGSHQLRYGVQYEDIKYDNINQRTGPTFTLPDGTRTATGANVTVLPDPVLGRVFRVIRANLNSGRETKQKYLSAFLQDTWQIGKRLMLRPGVRYEQQELLGDEALPLCREGETVPGRADGSGALKACSFKWSGNFGPRLAATFDIKGDGKSKLFASWGRFFAKIPNDLAARAMSADAGVTRADYFDSGLTRPIPNGTLAAGVTTHFLPPAGLHAAQIASESKSTYQQEILGGIEYEVARNLNVGVRYIHRTLPRIIEDYQPAPVVAFELGCPGAESVEYFIDNISPSLQRFTCPGIPDASFENPEHTYDSVEITANKTFADNWSMVTSYRWARLKGLFEGFFRNDNGQSDPSISSLFDFPTNDPSYTQIGGPLGYRGDIRFQGCTLGCGELPNDRAHQLKVYANRAWGAFNAGVGFNAGSGRPLTELAANPNYGNAGEIPLTLRGGGINTVDGVKKRSPAEISFDAHVDYTIKLAGERRVLLIADAFNLLNRTSATDYDNCSDLGFGTSNPNFGQAGNGCTSRSPSFQAPRGLRLGARFEW